MRPHLKRTSKTRRDSSEAQQSDCGERTERHAREGERERERVGGHRAIMARARESLRCSFGKKGPSPVCNREVLGREHRMHRRTKTHRPWCCGVDPFELLCWPCLAALARPIGNHHDESVRPRKAWALGDLCGHVDVMRAMCALELLLFGYIGQVERL